MNIPYVSSVKTKYKGAILCVVTSASEPQDGFFGCLWHAYDENAKVISYGFSKGRGGTGSGSMLTAMANARRAARRYGSKP